MRREVDLGMREARNSEFLCVAREICASERTGFTDLPDLIENIGVIARDLRPIENKDMVCVHTKTGNCEIGRTCQDTKCRAVLFQDDDFAVRIAREAAAEELGTHGVGSAKSGLEIVFFRRGLSRLCGVERGVIENDSDPARGSKSETSLSDAWIIEIVGEHLDLNGVVIQRLIEHFVNLASSCVA